MRAIQPPSLLSPELPKRARILHFWLDQFLGRGQAKDLIESSLEDYEEEVLPVEEDEFEEIQEEPGPNVEADTADSVMEQAAKYLKYSAIWSLIWVGGIGSLIAICYGVIALNLLKGYPRVLKTKAIFGVVWGTLGLFIWFVIWNSFWMR
jgi:hypothetical protein